MLDIHDEQYELTLTNYETKKMFGKMVSGGFGRYDVMLELKQNESVSTALRLRGSRY